MLRKIKIKDIKQILINKNQYVKNYKLKFCANSDSGISKVFISKATYKNQLKKYMFNHFKSNNYDCSCISHWQ